MPESERSRGRTEQSASGDSNGPTELPGVVALPVLIYAGFLALGLVLEWLWPTDILPEVLQYALAAPLVLGGGLIVWLSQRTFERSGVRYDVRQAPGALVTAGPLRWSRNPGYLALSLIYLGLALGIDGAWLLGLYLPLHLVVRHGVIGREERYLEQRFGADYRAYKARVRRWL